MNNTDSTSLNFEVQTATVLMKRPTPDNQRKKTFSASLYEFLDLVQGRYKTVEVYDSHNRLKKTLTREEILSKATIVPFVNHVNEVAIYLVNYSTVE